MASIRELFHSLGNIYNLLTVGIGINREALKECLRKDDPQEIKNAISKVINGFDRLIGNLKDADKKVREIHDRVYKVIDPDTGKVK